MIAPYWQIKYPLRSVNVLAFWMSYANCINANTGIYNPDIFW